MKSKRILIITPFFYPHLGGSEVYMEEIYSSLTTKFPDFKIDILCYNSEKVTSYEKYRSLNIQRISCVSLLGDQYLLPNYLEILKFLILNRSKYNLIHTSTRFFESSWWAPIFAKITGTKIIITDHCAFHPSHPSLIVNGVARIIDLTLSNLFLHFYDQIFVENQLTQKFLLKKFGVHSKVIYGGVYLDSFPKTSKSSKDFRILFVGRLIETKGALLLLEAAKRFRDVKFQIVGIGPLFNKLEREILKKQLTNIDLLGKRSRKEVMHLMFNSDILVHPSYHSEGLPLVLLEAGAAKLAVIASNAGATNEVITDGKTGLLVEPKNEEQLIQALALLIKNKSFRIKLGNNLRKLVEEKYNWDKLSDKLYQNITNLLKN